MLKSPFLAFYNPLFLLRILGPKKLNDFKDLQNAKIAVFGILEHYKFVMKKTLRYALEFGIRKHDQERKNHEKAKP